MNVSIRERVGGPQATPLFVAFQTEQDRLLSPVTDLDAPLGGLIGRLLSSGEISGKAKTTTLIYTLGKVEPERVLIVGCGPLEKVTSETVRQAAGVAASEARRLKVDSYEVAIDGLASTMPIADLCQALTEGSLLALYDFSMKSEQERHEVDELHLTTPEIGHLAAGERAIRLAETLAQATMLTRDLTNAPCNVVTPTYLAERARRVAERTGLSCTILTENDMRDKRMGALLGVAQGSAEPPVLVVLGYRHPEARKTLAVVGKGVTFDTGGISIKPADKMDLMKTDMAGAATVIGFMQAISQLRPPLNILGVFPSVENMPGGRAFKPGDVLTASNGVTIEIINTDAEGRLILADALSYAVELGADALIDLATLTGACVVALGETTTGVMSNDDAMAQLVVAAGMEVGEKAWQLPLWPEYDDLMKSNIADIKNSGVRWGGAITAAAFLSHFVHDKPWVHMDIAGPSWTDKDLPYTPKGATGTGVRTLVEFAKRWV